jgi:hypothetical protein
MSLESPTMLNFFPQEKVCFKPKRPNISVLVKQNFTILFISYAMYSKGSEKFYLIYFENAVKKDYVRGKVSNFRQKIVSGIQNNSKRMGVSS